jgi:glycerol-3-phosphate dehydrogenase
MIYSKGTLLITHNRISNHVINRLRVPSDGDILVPGGTVSIFGTTSVRINTLDTIRPTIEETDLLVKEAAAMVPQLENTRYIRAYAGVRPLISQKSAESKISNDKAGPGDDRSVSRGFYLIDHQNDDLDNFITITGGKLTTFRLMAQKTADLIAKKLHNTEGCTTAVTPLRSNAPSQMTEAGMSFRLWAQKGEKDDITMCECEMISRNQFKQLIGWLKKNRKKADLNALRIHSRLGKGACQGTFCSQRVTGFMYDEDYLKSDEGIYNIKDLLQERFIGQRPVLWGNQLAQTELNEALFCGFYGLELEK